VPDSIADPARARVGAFTAIASVLFAGLATGALWCLLSLGLRRGEVLLILPLAAGVGVYFRWLGLVGARGAVCAIASILLAFAYAQYLFAAVRIAQMLGFPLRSTLFSMDAGLAWQAMRANVGALDFVVLLLAVVIGVGITTLPRLEATRR
jgi:hypothetical protein